jgi:hypothetical protein
MKASRVLLALLLLSRPAAGQLLCPNPPPAAPGAAPAPAALAAPGTTERCGPRDPLPNLAAVSSLVSDALEFDFTTDPYSLVSATIQFKDDGTKQKLSLTPLKLQRDRTAWDGWTIGLVTGGSTATLSTGVAYDQAAHYAPRRRNVIREFNLNARPTPPLRGAEESLAAYTARVDTLMAQAYSDYWMRRFRHTNVFSLTGALQTFAGLPASRVDLDGDSLTDNEYAVKSYGVTAQWTHRWSFWTAGTLTLQAGERRTAAKEDTPLRTFYGAGISVARTVFILDPEYMLSKDYRSKLYVPSISAGASFDWQQCDGAPLECDDRIVERWTAMPFVDVRLPGGAQFKLGIPFKNERIGDTSGTRIEPLLQFGWSLATL